MTIYQFFCTRWWAKKEYTPKHRQYFNGNANLAHHPGYTLGHERIWRNQGHICNAACDIRTMTHWLQNA